MIFTAIIKLFSTFATFVISFFPTMYSLPSWFGSFMNVLKTGLYFFPADVLVVVMANVFFCNFALVAWSVVEWVYKKIPGVD